MPPSATLSPQAFEIGATAKAKLALHHRKLAIPVDLLHMHRRDSETVTALGATSTKHLASAFGLHTLTETVYAQTTALLGLPGSLYHNSSFLHENSKPLQRGAIVQRKSKTGEGNP